MKSHKRMHLRENSKSHGRIRIIDDNDEVQEEGMNNRDDEPKTRKSRARNPTCESLNVNGRTGENNGSENGANGGGGQKEEKRKLSFEISLSKWQIEEDIYSLSG
ncbi:Uncharacterized protein Adt_44300 [Abeliophyllum distichum]|uniref:Uncharacterized protein n=1 Tax=Abeliophyllum distichum TaxID=126358 RepID=A0ABD1PAF0_9LAMI